MTVSLLIRMKQCIDYQLGFHLGINYFYIWILYPLCSDLHFCLSVHLELLNQILSKLTQWFKYLIQVKFVFGLYFTYSSVSLLNVGILGYLGLPDQLSTCVFVLFKTKNLLVNLHLSLLTLNRCYEKSLWFPLLLNSC